MLKSELIKENERLRRELSIVCTTPSSFEAVMIIKKEQTKDRLERSIWFGDMVKSDEEINRWHTLEGIKERFGINGHGY
jgi:hypothetical protein